MDFFKKYFSLVSSILFVLWIVWFFIGSNVFLLILIIVYSLYIAYSIWYLKTSNLEILFYVFLFFVIFGLWFWLLVLFFGGIYLVIKELTAK